MQTMFNNVARAARVAALAIVTTVVLAGCSAGTATLSPGSAQSPPPTQPTASIIVSPSTATIGVGGQTLAFSATVANTANTGVSWHVNGVAGGNPTYGTISAAGLYSSPATLPAQAAVTITAVDATDSTVSGSAKLTLTGSAQVVAVTVSPVAASVQAATGTLTLVATVTGATDTSVTWQVNGVTGGNATVGTITTAGVFTAPATIPAQPTVTVTAISNADKTKSATAVLTITATPPPTIGGTPPSTVVVGQVYDFKPTASGPSGLPLSFSSTSKPAWATLNTATGELTGTPTAADVGPTTIAITVSDTAGIATLTWTLTVVQTASGSANLSWTAPTTHTDGSTMTDLTAYRIYYGTQQGNLTNRVDVANPTVTTSVINNLTAGTWYFAVTAVDSGGNESAYSNIGSKTI